MYSIIDKEMNKTSETYCTLEEQRQIDKCGHNLHRIESLCSVTGGLQYKFTDDSQMTHR